MTERVTIPLPDHLLDKSCGCPHAEMGMHRTACKPAREYEAVPLKDRAGYADGASFRCVSWQYPLSITVDLRLTLEIDVKAYIEAHRDQYEAFEMEPGYEAWEKPMVWLSTEIEESAGELEMPWAFDRHLCRARVDADDHSEHPRWTEESYQALNLSPPVDPNQGDLFAEQS